MPGSKLIYVRLEADDSVQLEMPHFCPRRSRLALSLGVAEWIVARPDSLAGYSSADYDAIAQLRRQLSRTRAPQTWRRFETTFDRSNISQANEIAGSLTGSQRRQIPGYTRRHPAIAGTAKRHVRRLLALSSHTSKVPPKQ